jgi:hypothetical protein
MAKPVLLVLLCGALGSIPIAAVNAADCVHNLDRQTLITIGPSGAAPIPCPGETTILRAGEVATIPAEPRSPSSASPLRRSDAMAHGNDGATIREHDGDASIVRETEPRRRVARPFDVEPFAIVRNKPFVINRSIGPATTGNIGPFTTGSLAPFTTGSFGASFVDPDAARDAAGGHEMMRRRQ